MANNNSMVQVPVKDIAFATYQRTISSKVIDAIVNDFDAHRMRPIELSFRDGRLWCFDGQHRVLAYKKMGIEKIPAQIHYGLSYEDEAMLFTIQHENEHRVRMRDRWNAGSAAGDKMANFVEIKKIAEERGYKIDPNRLGGKDDVISCVATVVNGHKAYGAAGLKKVIDTIDASWGQCSGRTNANIIGALFKIYGTYDGEINWDRLVNCLSKHTAESFMRDSKDERGKGSAQIARHMVNVYNRKLQKNKIDVFKIHG